MKEFFFLIIREETFLKSRPFIIRHVHLWLLECMPYKILWKRIT